MFLFIFKLIQLKIGILGTRGIPNRYGGFEEFAAQVSKVWADRGHDVFVYCEDNSKKINGVVELLIKLRKEARENKDWTLSDQIRDELIELLTNQVVDLTMMSKIELGDDVIAEIKRLNEIING